jgi:hypothetical protein
VLTERWRRISGATHPGFGASGRGRGQLRAGQRRALVLDPGTRLGGLTGTATDDTDDDFFAAIVANMRRRQAAGELTADLDPAYVPLLLFAAAHAPVLLPRVARRMTGEHAESAAFLDAYREQLRRVVERLGQ